MTELLVTIMRIEHSPTGLYLSQVDRSKLRMFSYVFFFHQEERLKLAEKRREKKLKQDLDAEGLESINTSILDLKQLNVAGHD